MFGGELKSKKEQKNLEQILKTIVSTTKEKTKNEACLKLLDIFENTLDININFDYLLQSIDDLSECSSAQCRRIWLQVNKIIYELQIAMQIIKFRSDYRTKLFNKMMKIVFELNTEDNQLKIRVKYSYYFHRLFIAQRIVVSTYKLWILKFLSSF